MIKIIKTAFLFFMCYNVFAQNTKEHDLLLDSLSTNCIPYKLDYFQKPLQVYDLLKVDYEIMNELNGISSDIICLPEKELFDAINNRQLKIENVYTAYYELYNQTDIKEHKEIYIRELIQIAIRRDCKN